MAIPNYNVNMDTTEALTEATGRDPSTMDENVSTTATDTNDYSWPIQDTNDKDAPGETIPTFT